MNAKQTRIKNQMPNFISEHQIEQALVQKLQHRHGFDVLNCHTVNAKDLNDGSNRARKRDVILVDRVRDVALRLNPNIPPEAIENALEKLCEQRQAISLIAANQEIYGLLRDGIPVTFDNAQGQSQQGRVRLLDFNVPSNNRYLVVTQLWIKGRRGFCRPDVLLYVNGIPLVLIALRNSTVALRNAYDDNLTNFKTEIPQLFLTNAFCVLSNAVESKVGSITAQWQHYFNWLRVDDEKQQIDRTAIRAQGTSLESVIEGLLPQQKLLDYVENFVLYDKDTQKIIAQNHQFIGVNRAYGVFLKRRELLGKLGVFWHTQGSEKDFSIIFYVRKIFRKQTGNFTFVVVTDRDDLDSQIYHNFLHTRTVSETETAQPKHSKEMRKFLAQNKRIVFTLIQKFRWDKDREYPELSARNDIIVILAKTHGAQYQSLMANMCKGLPKANYLAFTDVPLLGRERKTNAWFGSYVSEYNFQRSIDDGATVPLFYRKRLPAVLIQKERLSEQCRQNLENEDLDEAQQTRLEQRLTKAAKIIKRDERLEKIARDIVDHFPRRGYLGKALLVSVDKFTAVKMYDKVQRLWKQEISTLKGIISKTPSEIEKRRLRHRVEFMRTVEMAVVISKDTGEKEKFAAQSLAIKPHRERMDKLDEYGHDIEYNYQDPEHPLQLVFVCAMWLTDFDAPTLSTLYLDKPMRGHTLMRTIARTNRVTSWKINEVEKRNGEIVDYCNVFNNLKLALKDYTQEDDETEWPVKEKAELFRLLDNAIEQGFVFCNGKAVALREA
ncbi:MAG TPA: HsdR family type I site-specific deoxyribonuclease, partial [Nitrosomonas sp.]|nr:HsdR family type I site-specific deoxyribonuclease [Nitrosomonas sp.]